ncbi:MAG: PQQ-binding-like beta-propeller repeat protein, partial [candidate division WOR-3 bacterium]
MRKLVFLTAGLLVPALLVARLDPVWVNTYDGPYGNSRPSEEAAIDIAVDRDGYAYACGGGLGPLWTTADYITIKYDPTTGETLWVRFYQAPAGAEDQAMAIAVDDAGGVYVTGYSHTIASGFDYATVKYDAADGTELWVARYSGPGDGNDYPCAIAVDDGGVYVTGYSYTTAGDFDYATVKYSASNGEERWVAYHDGSSTYDDYAYAIAVDNSGGVYVTGCSYTTTSNFDYATVKYSASEGEKRWVAYYDGPSSYDDYAYAMAVDSSGGVYVTGCSYTTAGSCDYATLKYDASDGNVIWLSRYNGRGNSQDGVYAIALDNAGGVYVTGYSYTTPSNCDYATLKYDAADGTEAWFAGYSGPGNGPDYAYDIAADNFGRVYVTGASLGSGSSYDYLTAAYDTETGEELGVHRHAGSAGYDDCAWAMATDAQGCVYVTGYCQNLGTSYDIVTIKYTDPTAIDAVIDIDPSKLNLKGNGKWVTCYIELPEGSSVEDIDTSTVAVNVIDGDPLDPPLYREGPTEVGDYDQDDVSDLMVKFSRQKLVGVLIDMGYGDGDKPELTVTGGLAGGAFFKGVAAVELIDKEGGRQGTAGLPGRVSIQQTSPNPFRLFTTVGYGLPAPTHVRLEVYGPAGERVATLVDRL